MDQQAGEDVHWFPQLESNKMVLALCESFLTDSLYILSKHYCLTGRKGIRDAFKYQ